MFDFKQYKTLLDDCYRFNRELAKELYPEYPGEDIGFLYDGPIMPNEWGDQNPKIMFLAMEHYGYWDCEPRLIYNETDISPRFHKIVAWFTCLITNFVRGGRIFTEEESQSLYRDHEQLLEWWRKSCYVELKKISGDESQADVNEVLSQAGRNLSFLQKQVELLQPEIIFCCGQSVFQFFIQNFDVLDLNSYKYDYNQWCYVLKDNKIVINSQHPSWRFYKRFHAYNCIVNDLKKIGIEAL